jgi:hypothetical protein
VGSQDIGPGKRMLNPYFFFIKKIPSINVHPNNLYQKKKKICPKTTFTEELLSQKISYEKMCILNAHEPNNNPNTMVCLGEYIDTKFEYGVN